MRILLVAHGFPPTGLGGTEIYTCSLAKGFKQRGHTVHVFFREGDIKRPEYSVRHGTYQGIEFTSVNNTWTQFADYSETYANPKVDAIFGKVVDEFRPDVVHFCYLLCGLSAAMLAEAEQRNIPTVVTLTDFHWMCPLGQLLTLDQELCDGPERGTKCARCLPYLVNSLVGKAYATPKSEATPHLLKIALRWARAATRRLPVSAEKVFSLQHRLLEGYMSLKDRLMPHKAPTVVGKQSTETPLTRRDAYLRSMIQKASIIVAPTRHLMHKFIEWGVPEGKIIYSEFGMDTELFVGYAHKPSEVLRFGYIGQMLPIKGVHVLLEAFSAYEHRQDVELLIWANTTQPPAQDYLSRMGRLTKLKNVRFLGTFEHTRIAEVLSEIDVLVLPSLWVENSPLVLRNAILARTPVIASNLPGMSVYVEPERTGLLFEAGKSADLRAKMDRFIQDPTLAACYRANIQATTKTLENDMEELETLYAQPGCQV